MNDLNPKETSPNNDFDEQLVLTFLTNYHSLEQALVQAGFTRAGHTPGNPRPDWGKFARHIERRFDPDSSPELMGAVCYLLGEPEEQELRRERLQASIPWELSSPASDILWLSELVQEIRNRLLLRINFADKAWSDDTGALAALFIVEAWSYIDPKVESMLTHVH